MTPSRSRLYAIALLTVVLPVGAQALTRTSVSLLNAVERQAKIVRMGQLCRWPATSYAGSADYIQVAGKVASALGEPSSKDLATAARKAEALKLPSLLACTDAAGPLAEASSQAGATAFEMRKHLRPVQPAR